MADSYCLIFLTLVTFLPFLTPTDSGLKEKRKEQERTHYDLWRHRHHLVTEFHSHKGVQWWTNKWLIDTSKCTTIWMFTLIHGKVSLSVFQVKDGLSQILLNVQIWQVGFWFVYTHRKSNKHSTAVTMAFYHSAVKSDDKFIIFAYMTAIQADFIGFNVKKVHLRTNKQTNRQTDRFQSKQLRYFIYKKKK